MARLSKAELARRERIDTNIRYARLQDGLVRRTVEEASPEELARINKVRREAGLPTIRKRDVRGR